MNADGRPGLWLYSGPDGSYKTIDYNMPSGGLKSASKSDINHSLPAYLL